MVPFTKLFCRHLSSLRSMSGAKGCLGGPGYATYDSDSVPGLPICWSHLQSKHLPSMFNYQTNWVSELSQWSELRYSDPSLVLREGTKVSLRPIYRAVGRRAARDRGQARPARTGGADVLGGPAAGRTHPPRMWEIACSPHSTPAGEPRTKTSWWRC